MNTNSERSSSKSRMPALFVPHGAGPCFFMEWNPLDAWVRMAEFLTSISARLPRRPRAIVLISGHWLEQTVTVTTSPKPELIFDYHGFPPHTYELTYPAPGNPELASRIIRLLGAAGIAAAADALRGFDHGVFIPLKLVFPNADIPVVQLSLRSDLDARAHLEIGRSLAPLRDDGVLIIGSGMSFHNMRGYGDPRFAPISDQFDHWLEQSVTAAPAEREAALQRWDEAPSARLCHPPRAEEHLLPLLVAAGAGSGDAGTKIFSDRVMQTTLSAFQFG